MPTNGKAVGYLVPHTHWDREWRYPVWKNRMLLIDFMEALLNILDTDSDYHCFLMDGQCVPIEDYLEVSPEKKEKVCNYIKAGRIAIGPWYTLPDLYPIDGECLARNLLKGIRLSEKYGGCQKIAYNSFGWGQTAQLPQIYKEFGFDFIVAAKKVSEERAPESEFLWESPDGTQVLTTRLGKLARANFYFHAYIKIRYGWDYLDDSFKYDPKQAGLAYHKASVSDQDEDYFLIAPKEAYHPEFIKEGVEKAWDATNSTLLKNHRLLLSGCDFSTPQPDLTKIIKDANEIFNDREFINCRLEEYAQKAKELIDKSKLRVLKGELRDGPACDCSGNALSSRIHIKQLNKKVQNAIIHTAEPLASILRMMGKEYPCTLLDIAWKYMLRSHAHDSINGVVQDKTADDTVYHLNQALEIGNVVYEKLTGEVIKLINLSKHEPDDLLLVVFNPIAGNVSDVVKVCIDTPQDKNIWNFTAVDCDGEKVDIQEVSRQEKSVPVHDMDSRPWPHYIDRHICYIDCRAIPAGGYKVFKIVPQKNFKRNWSYPLEMRITDGKEISKAANHLENEYLTINIESNGTLTITDKRIGIRYSDMHYFEDTGDIGNYWSYYPPYHNKTINSLGSVAKMWTEDNGSLSATIAVEVSMKIPAFGYEPVCGIKGESKRSEEETTLVITSWITLKRGSQKVDIKTKVNNTAKNHRLRIAFPTGIKTEYACASGHFTVDKRPVLSAKNTDGKFYPEMQTLPMQHFVDISDGQRGLALLNNCLTEYELANDEKTHLYLTLFRSVSNMILTGWRCTPTYPQQKGSYLLHQLDYEYSIYPHDGNFEKGNVYREAEKLNNTLMPIQISQHSMGSLPEKLSFFSIEPENLILSAFKKAEDRNSLIMRLFNPLDTQIIGCINLHIPVTEVFLTDMNETRLSELNLTDHHKIPVKVSPHKIITLEFVV